MVSLDVFALLGASGVVEVDLTCDRMSWGEPDMHAMVSVGNEGVMMCSGYEDQMMIA